MNDAQILILLAGVTVGGCECLFPRWASVISGASYPPMRQFIFSPPPATAGTIYLVDIELLGIHLIAILTITLGLFFLAGLLSERKQKNV